MPDLDRDFWDAEREKLRAVIEPIIQEVIEQQLEDSVADLLDMGMEFDDEGFSEAAVEYATEYTDTLLQQLGTTTETGVGVAIAEWLQTPGATVGDLQQRLVPLLEGNMARASTIGVTEVTRASVQGDMIAYDEAGVEMPSMFPNPIGIDEPFGPPLHPNCRCMTAVVRHNDRFVIVWVTNHDDLVCPDPTAKTMPEFDVPWGTVNGCADLDGVCISAGELEGEQIR
jgi:hypothetical protein